MSGTGIYSFIPGRLCISAIPPSTRGGGIVPLPPPLSTVVEELLCRHFLLQVMKWWILCIHTYIQLRKYWYVPSSGRVDGALHGLPGEVFWESMGQGFTARSSL